MACVRSTNLAFGGVERREAIIRDRATPERSSTVGAGGLASAAAPTADPRLLRRSDGAEPRARLFELRDDTRRRRTSYRLWRPAASPGSSGSRRSERSALTSRIFATNADFVDQLRQSCSSVIHQSTVIEPPHDSAHPRSLATRSVGSCAAANSPRDASDHAPGGRHPRCSTTDGSIYRLSAELLFTCEDTRYHSKRRRCKRRAVANVFTLQAARGVTVVARTTRDNAIMAASGHAWTGQVHRSTSTPSCRACSSGLTARSRRRRRLARGRCGPPARPASLQPRRRGARRPPANRSDGRGSLRCPRPSPRTLADDPRLVDEEHRREAGDAPVRARSTRLIDQHARVGRRRGAREERVHERRVLVDVDDDEAHLARRRELVLIRERAPAVRAPGREELDDRDLAGERVGPRAGRRASAPSSGGAAGRRGRAARSPRSARTREAPSQWRLYRG